MSEWVNRTPRPHPSQQHSGPEPIPSVACPILHLEGPGRVRCQNNLLAFDRVDGPQHSTPQLLFDPQDVHHLLCYGNVNFSTEALHVLFEKDVPVALLSFDGQRYLGRIVGAESVVPVARYKQLRMFCSLGNRLIYARRLIADKIASEITAARHYQRHGVTATETITRLKQFADKCPHATSIEALRGLEGGAAATWFEFYGRLFRKPWKFEKRVRRPPTDPVNSLLSLGYTLLTSRTEARLQAMCWDAALGILHEYRSGRPSLACDQVEPLRAPAVDRWVVRILNEGRLEPKDFRFDDATKGIRLTSDAFPKVLMWWETQWKEERLDMRLDEQLARMRRQFADLSERSPTPIYEIKTQEGWADS